MSKILLSLLILSLVAISGCVGNAPEGTGGNDNMQEPENPSGDDPGSDVPDMDLPIPEPPVNDTPPEQDEPADPPFQEPDPEPQVPTIQETISLCNSLCRSNADAYCEEERTIEVSGTEVSGTCRAFAKKGNVPGFSRCTGFCKSFDNSGTECTVNGSPDPDCDGTA